MFSVRLSGVGHVIDLANEPWPTGHSNSFMSVDNMSINIHSDFYSTMDQQYLRSNPFLPLRGQAFAFRLSGLKRRRGGGGGAAYSYIDLRRKGASKNRQILSFTRYYLPTSENILCFINQ